MAQQRVGNLLGVPALNIESGAQKTNLNGSTSVQGEHSITNLSSILSMRTRLAAIDGNYYTSDRLDKMTRNDMIYAIRLNDYAGTIKA